MAEHDYEPVDDAALRRMLDAGLDVGVFERVEYADGELPRAVDSATVTAMAAELLERRAGPSQ